MEQVSNSILYIYYSIREAVEYELVQSIGDKYQHKIVSATEAYLFTKKCIIGLPLFILLRISIVNSTICLKI